MIDREGRDSVETYLSWKCQDQFLKAVAEVVCFFVPHCETFLPTQNSLVNVTHPCFQSKFGNAILYLSWLSLLFLHFPPINVI